MIDYREHAERAEAIARMHRLPAGVIEGAERTAEVIARMRPLPADFVAQAERMASVLSAMMPRSALLTAPFPASFDEMCRKLSPHGNGAFQ